jgi:hypothetical protein
MSPTLERVSYTLAIPAGLIAFWVAGCSPARDDILERIFSMTTQISSLAWRANADHVDAVPDDLTAAVITDRSELINRALEAVERVLRARHFAISLLLV